MITINGYIFVKGPLSYLTFIVICLSSNKKLSIINNCEWSMETNYHSHKHADIVDDFIQVVEPKLQNFKNA